MIFITGSKGFIGQKLTAECKKRNIDVIEADLPEVDIRSKDVSKFIPEGIDAVVHLAALSSDPACKNKGYECFDANVMGTLNLIKAAEEKKAKQFIFASSEWVYDNCSANEVKTEESVINIANHTSEYALSKLVSEANLREKYQHGFCPVTILRFGIIYGPRESGSAIESLFNAVKTKDEVRVGCVKTGRHFIYVSDIVSGIIKSIGLAGFDIINLEGDKLIVLEDVIETSKKILNKNPRIIEENPNNASIRLVSNEKAKKLLGWKPEIDLETGLRLIMESRNLKLKMLEILHKGQASHIGPCLSVLDILSAIYEIVDVGKIKNKKEDRDRVIISKGHSAAAIFSILWHLGIISDEEINSYHKNGSLLGGHAMHDVPGIEHSTGALGHGLPVGVGIALGLKAKDMHSKVFVVTGDGELHEGSNWEAMQFATHHKLSNLYLLIDYNKFSAVGAINDCCRLEPLKVKIEAFGFEVIEAEGHDKEEIKRSILGFKNNEKPKAIICHTIKGRGISFMEKNMAWQYRPLNKEDYEKAVCEVKEEK